MHGKYFHKHLQNTLSRNRYRASNLSQRMAKIYLSLGILTLNSRWQCFNSRPIYIGRFKKLHKNRLATNITNWWAYLKDVHPDNTIIGI